MSLGTAEIVVRMKGYQPWDELRFPNNPPLLEPDPIRGWRNKPGYHRFPGYSSDVETVRISILPDGTRATQLQPPASPPSRDARIALIGDSITEGWAVSDEETFAWKLQSRFPKVEFINYGTAGYGSYQSLLLLRKILADSAPALILYGFNDDHERRNVADYSWIRARDLNLTRTGNSALIPYCLLDPHGGLVEHMEGTSYRMPLRTWSAAARVLEDAVLRARTADRMGQARAVTQRLIDEMSRLAHSAGSEFAVVFLLVNPRVGQEYAAYLSRSGIPFIDCSRRLAPDKRVVGEGHPNGKLHSEWADCLADAIPSRFPMTAMP